MLQICLWLSVLFIMSLASVVRHIISMGKTDGVIVFNISQHDVNIFSVKRELLEIIFHSFCMLHALSIALLVFIEINIIRYEWHFHIVGGAVSLYDTR